MLGSDHPSSCCATDQPLRFPVVGARAATAPRGARAPPRLVPAVEREGARGATTPWARPSRRCGSRRRVRGAHVTQLTFAAGRRRRCRRRRRDDRIAAARVSFHYWRTSSCCSGGRAARASIRCATRRCAGRGALLLAGGFRRSSARSFRERCAAREVGSLPSRPCLLLASAVVLYSARSSTGCRVRATRVCRRPGGCRSLPEALRCATQRCGRG